VRGADGRQRFIATALERMDLRHQELTVCLSELQSTPLQLLCILDGAREQLWALRSGRAGVRLQGSLSVQQSDPQLQAGRPQQVRALA
jgi:hypothetical protein